MEYKIKNHVGASNTSCADKYLIFHVEGGLGKNIASTAVVTHLKKKYNDRKIIVVASYPEVFLNNENIYRVYRFGVCPYFYDDYIHKKDTIVLRKEPYYENNHIMRKTPLYETWFNMYDIPYDKKEINPYLPMNGMQEIWTKEWQRQKPVLLLQTNGGPLDENMQPNAYAWTRDMPLAVAEIIVKAAAQKYHIIRVCRSNSYHLEGVERVDAPLNNFQLFSLVRASQKRLLIDSCLHHAAAAFKIPCTVLWVGTDPKMFGYNVHNNICAREPSGNIKRVDSYLFDYDFHGNRHEFPYYSNDVIFDSKEILNSLNL
tara:strand:- start:2593 stop:3537 length:945 start_codon:yes stop_codon:yes gene_type:complete